MKKKALRPGFLTLAVFLILSATATAQDHFTVSKETITDTRTGLVWQKKAFSISRMMQTLNPDAGKGDKMTFNSQTLRQFVEKFNAAQKTDWRIPSIDELKLLAPFLTANSLEKKQVLYLAKAEKETDLLIYFHRAHQYMKDFFEEPGVKNAGSGRIYALILVRGQAKPPQ